MIDMQRWGARWRRQVVVGSGALLTLLGSVPGTTSSPLLTPGLARMHGPARVPVPRPAADTLGDRTASTASADAIHEMAVAAFATDLGTLIRDGGLLTDELRAPLSGPGSHRDALDHPGTGVAGGSGGWPYSAQYPWRRLSWLDIRQLPERWNSSDTTTEHGLGGASQEVFLDEGYLGLQGTRAIISTALEQLTLAARGTTTATALNAYRGELYALEGYDELLLADLFCSGVPLNTFAAPLTTMLTLGPGTHGPLALPAGGTHAGETFTSHAPWITFSRYDLNGIHRVNLRGAPTDMSSLYSTIVQGGQVYGIQLPVTSQVYLNAMTAHLVVYRPSLTTTQLYRDALAKFDTAVSLVGDSTRILNLARVGKGRAWLALGAYDSAAVAVRAVPRGFAYRVRSFLNLDPDGDEILATVADREGKTGLPYLSRRDPRTATQVVPSDKGMGQFQFPTKFWPDSDRARGLIQQQRDYRGDAYDPWQMEWPITLASWEEAVLIRAEAALHAKSAAAGASTWLQLLNELRATAPIPGTTRPDPVKLGPLKDPGSTQSRIALLFAERAYWLFLTGERQGDLRRLVREYRWPQEQVYPTGPYRVAPTFLPQVGRYGVDVNLPIPPEELSNPHFLGCLDRGA